MVLALEREPDNRYDQYAVKVMAPAADLFPAAVLEDITRDHAPIQRVKDVVGEMIGRVPRHLCEIISRGLREGWLRRAVAFHTGGVDVDGPMRGGGPKLKACYLLSLEPNRGMTMRRMADMIRPHLDNDEHIAL